jgi:hypothetical protein
MPSNRYAYNAFLKGVKRLSQLYDFSMHCYSHVSDDLQARLDSGELQPESHVKSKRGFIPHHRVATTLAHVKEYFPKELRSVILVRLVSALEVFLIDQIEESAASAERIFREDVTVEWPRGKLGAFESLEELREAFISADCRNLSSAGFDEVRKYYKKHLGIDICPPNTSIESIREVHARRHLHVHNAGIVDEKYTREFGAAAKVGYRLGVSDTYLRDAVSLIRSVAKHVAAQARAKFPTKKGTRIRGKVVEFHAGDVLYIFKGKFKDVADASAYFTLDRELYRGNGVKIGDLLHGAELHGALAEWTIVGNQARLEPFFIDLRRSQETGALHLITSKRLTPK